MNKINTAPVVVGISGSAADLAGVRLAAKEAAAMARPLRLVHAFVWPGYVVPHYEDLRGEVDEIMKDAVATALAAMPDLPVSEEVVDGPPTSVLLHESHSAVLVVLGGGKMAGRVCVPVDSIVVQVAARASCPVLVACGRGSATGPVLVGVDGSTDSAAATCLAFEEAARHGAPVRAVCVEEGRPGAELLADALAGCVEKYPQVEVGRQCTGGEPTDVLVAESAAARLLVVGARGHFRPLLGPVSQSVLHHSRCPVVVVRGEPTGVFRAEGSDTRLVTA